VSTVKNAIPTSPAKKGTRPLFRGDTPRRISQSDDHPAKTLPTTEQI
jgi:hypothetical protein